MGASTSRYSKGQSAVELVVGLLILIPILLFLIDIGSLVLANYVNDDVCQRTCRAAANQGDKQTALAAATTVLAKITPQQGMIGSIELMDPATGQTPANDIDFDSMSPGNVIVSTRVTANLPVPIPFMGDSVTKFVTRSSLPITALKAK